LIEAFELIAERVVAIRPGPRIEVRRARLIHPVHQCMRAFAWEVLGRTRWHLGRTT
jgi:hypothetical protein